MKTLTIIYLAATAAVFAYVGGVCFFNGAPLRPERWG